MNFMFMKKFYFLVAMLGVLLTTQAWAAEGLLTPPDDSGHSSQTIRIEDIEVTLGEIDAPDESLISFIAETQSSPLRPVERKDEKKIDDTSQTCETEHNNEVQVTVCENKNEMGNTIKTIDQQFTFGREKKHQLVTKEYSPEGKLLHKKSIRGKIQTDYDESDQLQVKTLLVDVVETPSRGRIVRNLMSIEFDEKSGNLKDIHWSHYRQVEKSKSAQITHHIQLNYDEKGHPLKGLAERWKKDEAERVFHWNAKNATSESHVEEWQRWEDWILKLISQNSPTNQYASAITATKI